MKTRAENEDYQLCSSWILLMGVVMSSGISTSGIACEWYAAGVMPLGKNIPKVSLNSTTYKSPVLQSLEKEVIM